MTASQHSRPALHNAMWPGLVGKGGPDAEPRCGYISGVIPLPRYHYWITEQAAKLGSPLEP